MDTAILIAIFLIALVILSRLPGKGAAVSHRRYYTDTVTRAVQRGGDLEADCVYIWTLKSRGWTSSRRAVTRRGEMTAHRWNRASALLTHLSLDANRYSYAEGVERIRQFLAEQDRLSRSDTYVPPV